MRPIFFTHVMKTGGISLTDRIRREVGGDRSYPDPRADVAVIAQKSLPDPNTDDDTRSRTVVEGLQRALGTAIIHPIEIDAEAGRRAAATLDR